MTVSFDLSFTLEGTSSLAAVFPDSISIPSPNNEIHPPVLFSSAQQVRSRSNNCPIKDNWWPQAIILQLQVSHARNVLGHIIQYWLRGKGLILSESLTPSPEVVRVSLEISSKLPDEITKRLEDSKQWLQVCYHSQCLYKLWYTKNGKSSLAGCGEERNPSVESRTPMIYYSETVIIQVKAGVGSFEVLQRDRNQARKRNS